MKSKKQLPRLRELRMYKQTKTLTALGLALATAVTACSNEQPENAEDTVVELAHSDVATALRASIRSGVAITGTLDPFRTVEVKAQVPGTVMNLRVDRGDRVADGQPLTIIEAEGIRSQAAGAEAGVVAARATLAQARRELESARTLRDAGAMADVDFHAIQTAYEAAQAQLATAQAQAAGAAEQAQRTVVRAPLTGDVSERSVSAGEAVTVGQTLFTIVNSSRLELRGQVPVAQATRVAAGQPVEFTLDAYPGQVFTGTVARVSPVADPRTRQVGVTMTLPNGARTLIGGLFATGRVITGSTEEAVVVPPAALRGTNGERYVWVVDDGVLSRRSVMVGEHDELAGRVSIVSGIAVGDIVVISPGSAKEGSRVRIGNSEAGGPTVSAAKDEEATR